MKFHLFKRKFLLIFSVFLVFIASNSFIQKKYNLVYFKFGPEDLTIKVYPENINNITKPENTDYVMTKIDKNNANLFLVRDFANERDFVDYKYRVVFYKNQDIKSEHIQVPVYSILISFADEDTIVTYEPAKAIPAEIRNNNLSKTFKKNPNSNIYYIKDYTGDDFILNDRMRKVVFSGLVKNQDSTYKKIPGEFDLNLKLTKLEDADDINKADKVSKENPIIVPLNQEITLGLIPYKLENADQYSRYMLKSLLVDKMEKDVLLIHFAEVWNNMYEQNLVYADDDYFIDFWFDPQLYDLSFSLGKDKKSNYKNSPLSLSIKKYNNTDLSLNLQAKDFMIKYLAQPAQEIKALISSSKTGKDTIKEINNKYPESTKIRDDGSIMILPDFKKTPFAVFSDPEYSKIKIKKIEPVTKGTVNEYSELGNSPVFFPALEFGKYSFIAQWFNKDDSNLLEYTKEMVVEFSADPIKKNIENIRYLKKDETVIPYIFFARDYNLSENKNDINTDYLKNYNEIINKQFISDAFVNKQIKNNEIKQENKTVKNADVPKADNAKMKIENVDIKLESIKKIKSANSSKNRRFYIQIAAFDLNKYPVNYVNKYVAGLNVKLKDLTGKETLIAGKNVNDKKYIAVLYGPYDKTVQAKNELKSISKVAIDAFIIDDVLLKEIN